jgi:predicted DNA-binding transcriptional regulator AlpA
MTSGDGHCAVDLGECCRRLGISRRTGERLVAEGRFPIPELPRLGTGRGRRTYSTYDIELYLRDAPVRDAAPGQRRRLRFVSGN